MLAEELRQRLAQPSRAVPVHDAQPPLIRQQAHRRETSPRDRSPRRPCEPMTTRSRDGPATSARPAAAWPAPRRDGRRALSVRRRARVWAPEVGERTRMRLPRTSTSTCLPETPRTMPSAPKAGDEHRLADAGGSSSVRVVRVGCPGAVDGIADGAERGARLGAQVADLARRQDRGRAAARVPRRRPGVAPSASSVPTTRSTSARASRSFSFSRSSSRCFRTASRSASRDSRSSSAGRVSATSLALAPRLLPLALDARPAPGRRARGARRAATRGPDGARARRR